MAVLKLIGKQVKRCRRTVVQGRGSRKVEHDRARRRDILPYPGAHRADERISVTGR